MKKEYTVEEVEAWSKWTYDVGSCITALTLVFILEVVTMFAIFL